MDIEFRKVNSDEDLKILSKLAEKIWNIHYPPIIGQKQVDYMLKKMYSLESLKDQIEKDKNVFTAAFIDSEMAGFISVSKSAGKNFFLHKLYIDTKIKRKGIGSALFNLVFSNLDYDTIRLTVNRQNIQAINFYFKLGFKIEKVVDMDIGEGYFMNDFVMVCSK